MTLRERFEEMGVPSPDDLPRDLKRLIDLGLMQGRVLLVQEIRNEDGVVQNQWSFLTERREKRTKIITDPTKPPPYNPDDIQ